MSSTISAHGVADGHHALQRERFVAGGVGEGQGAHGLLLVVGQHLFGALALRGVGSAHVEHHLWGALHESHCFVAHVHRCEHVFLLGAKRLLAHHLVLLAQSGVVLVMVAKPQQQGTFGGIAHHVLAVELGGGVHGHGHVEQQLAVGIGWIGWGDVAHTLSS